MNSARMRRLADDPKRFLCYKLVSSFQQLVEPRCLLGKIVCVLNRIALIRVLRWESRFHDTQACVQGARQRQRQAGPPRGEEARQQGEIGRKADCEEILRHGKGDNEAQQEGGAETCEEASDQSGGEAKREACGQACEQAAQQACEQACGQTRAKARTQGRRARQGQTCA